jgi:hypothetical protein
VTVTLSLAELEKSVETCNRKVNESWCDSQRQYWTQRLKQAMGDLERRRERDGEEREKMRGRKNANHDKTMDIT